MALQACNGLVEVVHAGGRAPTDTLEAALGSVSGALARARQHEAASCPLRLVQRAQWTQALLALSDTCMHSEEWHAAWHGGAVCGATAGYLRAVALSRDMLKEGLLPLLEAATRQLADGNTFQLAEQFEVLLCMGGCQRRHSWHQPVLLASRPLAPWPPHAPAPAQARAMGAQVCRTRPGRPSALPALPAGCTAADVVGLRDPRHARPGLRNFSVLNVLWNGIQRLWLAVPQGQRAALERQGGAAARRAGGIA